MKKLFGSKDKGPKEQSLVPPPMQQTPMSTPIHQQFATRSRNSVDDERWEVVDQHTPPPTAPAPSPTRSPSPYTTAQNKQLPAPTLRKKAPPALGILMSLDPAPQPPGPGHQRNRSEERIIENGHRDKDKGKGGFWNRGGGDRERERERDRERERERAEMEIREREQQQRRERRDEENELTRKIGFLTATASEDWTLVLDVCDHASSSENAAKEAVRALRREFKYGEPAAQLAAARLWAIMLRNSSDVFISQCTSRKFLDTIEDLLTSSRISPVVRERVMDVLAAAAYASGSKKDSGFRGLWRRVKPKDKPEEGVPFDTEDAMFNPPLSSSRPQNYDNEYDNNAVPVPPIVYQNATPIVADTPAPAAKPRKRKTSENRTGEARPHRDREHRHREPRIIPPDEDMRRLFQECRIGVGNAALLTDALVTATPEDLRSEVIMEFHRKCIDSQELIFTQIPWASAGAERSRAAKDLQERERKRKNSENALLPDNDSAQESPASTREEDLLGELLVANEALLEAIKQYDDLERVAKEQETIDRSIHERRMDPAKRHLLTEEGMLPDPTISGNAGSSSRSRSPSPMRGGVHLGHETAMQAHQQTLAPPPAAPHGPRLPGMNISRTPSPAHAEADLVNGLAGMHVGAANYGMNERTSFDTVGRPSVDEQQPYHRPVPASSDDEENLEEPLQPSAKALGKRRVLAEEPESGSESGAFRFGNTDMDDDRLSDSDDEDTPSRMWQRAHHPVQHYVYDAVAERAEQRLREESQNRMIVNGVH
ncbi:hypothetical protein MKEN_01009200 [Mycena kentingensis (nom. inval.)]|nr:hypothetical protein MKEN_01009200 [Mycena kentingensis (nom. inval.)]